MSEIEHMESRPIEPIGSAAEFADKLEGLFATEDEQPQEVEATEAEAPVEEVAEPEEEIDAEEEIASPEAEVSDETEAEVEEDVAETEEPVVEAAKTPQPKQPSEADIRARMEREQQKQDALKAREDLNEILGRPRVQKPTKELLESDPYEYMRQKEASETDAAEFAKAQAEAAQHEQFLHQTFVQEETEKLRDIRPELFDPEKGDALKAEIGRYALDKGFDAQRLNYASAAEVDLLFKAMNYDRLQAKTPETKKVLKKAPPTLKAKASAPKTDPKSEKLKAARKRFSEKGDADSLAELLIQSEDF